MRFLLKGAIATIVVSLVLSATASVRADGAATLSVADSAPPDEVAQPIRDALASKVFKLSSDDKPFFEFWFRKQLPLAKEPEGGTLALDTVQEGTVLGVLKIDEDRRDFRDEELPRGIYVVRLGIQPENGNHQGVAPTRTFALMVPAKKDTKLEPMPHADLMKASATINAAKHPSNLNLQPVEDASGDFPRLDERNDGQHKVLLLKLPARVAGTDKDTTLTFALVYEGTGQL